MGRPSLISPEIIEALCKYVANGNVEEHSCYLVGIDESTLTKWKQKGREDLKNGVESIYSQLIMELKRARALAQVDMVEIARSSAKVKKDGYLAITFLERTDPKNWGRRDSLQVDENKQVTVNVIVKHYQAELDNMPPGPAAIEGEYKVVPAALNAPQDTIERAGDA
jgi:hypothetical protein